MAGLIADMLDYENTESYIEPFGGACRTLLNKKPHTYELYSDTSRGLCIFFEEVQKEKTCIDLQKKLLEFVPSEIEFWKNIQYKAQMEQSLLCTTTDTLKRYTARIRRKNRNENTVNAVRELQNAISDLDIEGILSGISKLKTYVGRQETNSLESFAEVYQMFWDNCEDYYNEMYEKGRALAEEELKRKKETLSAEEEESIVNRVGREYAFRQLDNLEEPMELSAEERTKLAAATFITFYFSRDGMGLSYSESRGENVKSYYKKIDTLSDIGKRMEDVKIINADAWFFLDNQLTQGAYLMNPNVMMYLDPSYLSVADVETGEKGGKNLGSSYDSSFGFKEHEKLLDNIIDAKAKILISNYDVEPYKSRLTEKKGWHRYEYETKTSVGGAKNNKRTEVLWYNY